MAEFHILRAGSRALLVETKDLDTAMALYASVERARCHGEHAFAGVRQVIPAARTVLIEYQPLLASAKDLAEGIRSLSLTASEQGEGRTVMVPVVYDGDDLGYVAQTLGMSKQALIDWHTGKPWYAAFAGFAPGFVYLTRGPHAPDVARRAKPRVTVPTGAVGLAGPFSGVYPRSSSGGWQLIGTTDKTMWNERRDFPATIRPRDLVAFTAVREHIVSVVDTPSVGSAPWKTTDGQPVLHVDSPGLLALMEDDGRVAASLGVTGSGSADRCSAHLANRLVGNPEEEPVIELTGGSAKFTALDDVVIAIAGAPVPIAIHTTNRTRGREPEQTDRNASDANVVDIPIERQEPFLLRSGESVRIGEPSSGLRDYLALQGGFAVERVLGSASTDIMSRLGPRPLHAGTQLCTEGHRHRTVSGSLPWGVFPATGQVTDLAIELGPRDDWFTERSISDLLETVWTVTPQSNRVGLRLHGATGLRRRCMDELPSEGTMPGSLEVPGDGQPVLFLRDQPVTGGYPVIAVLTPHSLMKAAQLPIGARLRFRVAGGTDIFPSDGSNSRHVVDRPLGNGKEDE